MTAQPLRFVSRNEYKISEARKILGGLGIAVAGTTEIIEELQTTESEKLVRDKVLKAFRIFMEPLFVEHTGLYLPYLSQFPGGLTQIFWDSLGASRVCELFGQPGRNSVEAKTTIGYIDGKRIHIFEGCVSGAISDTPRGPRGFQWDCVFVPSGHTETFAEMGERKNDISMRRLALNKFAEFLTGAA
jgi:XTP/dITP diphosphohydrolase